MSRVSCQLSNCQWVSAHITRSLLALAIVLLLTFPGECLWQCFQEILIAPSACTQPMLTSNTWTWWQPCQSTVRWATSIFCWNIINDHKCVRGFGRRSIITRSSVIILTKQLLTWLYNWLTWFDWLCLILVRVSISDKTDMNYWFTINDVFCAGWLVGNSALANDMVE